MARTACRGRVSAGMRWCAPRWSRLVIVLHVVLVVVLSLSACASKSSGGGATSTGAVFSDPALETAVREAIAKPTGSVSTADLQALTVLEAPNRGIANLAGLERCSKLIALDLSGNRI